MTTDRIIDKIRKCLALSKSSNPHEAAAALRQAQALMRLHGIDEQTLELADVQEACQAVASEQIPTWDGRLATMVGEAFGCRTLLSSWKVGPRAKESSWVFIGVGAAAEVARYAYEVLVRQCRAQRAAYIAEQPRACKKATKTGRGDAFAVGWVIAVEPMLERFAGRERHAELLDRYMEQRHGKLEKEQRGRRAGSDLAAIGAAVAGSRAGKEARLERGIGGTGAQLVIGA
jgi:hypothetical protein